MKFRNFPISSGQLLLPLLLPLLLLSSCDSGIELFYADQSKTYVVFGLLNSTDTIQQVKIRMTSVTDAPISEISNDSTEFSVTPALQVSIQEWHNNFYATYPFDRVPYIKEPGIFLNTRNDVYEARFTPFMDMDYKLIINNPDNGDLIESKILPVPAPKLGAPTWPWVRYNFSNEADPFNIRFYEVPRVYIYLISFSINYIEVNAGGDTLNLHASWVYPPRYTDDPPDYNPKLETIGGELNQHITGRHTYSLFQQLIPVDSTVVFRQLICFDISVWGGDRNLRNYTEFGLRFDDNRKQLFTNINNGIGFFGACSHSDCTGILPDQDFMDSLPLNPRTAGLKFRTSLYRTGHALSVRNHDSFLSLIREIKNEE